MGLDELDPLAILEALGISDVAHAVPVRGGADTAIWRVERAGVSYALRVFRPEQATTCQREVVAMAAAGEGGVPVPRVHAAGRWRDRPALLLSWCSGRTVLDELRTRPWSAWALGVRFGRMQAAIHAASAPDALANGPSWIEWAGADEALRTRLQALPPRPAVLLHLDYHPLNVMADHGQISGVLDWANARAGDPRADVARTEAMLRLAPPIGRGLSAHLAVPVIRVFLAGWRRGYEETAGPLGDLALFYAWAGAVMERDLAPRLGRPDLPWLTPAYLARIRRWTAGWRVRAGCPP